MERTGVIERVTGETDIKIKICLDGQGLLTIKPYFSAQNP